MKRCLNADCNKLISTTHRDSFVRAEVVGVVEHWCCASCYNQWMKQNLVFTSSADPFEARRRTNSEHRRKHY